MACDKELLRFGKGRKRTCNIYDSVRLEQKFLYLTVQLVQVAETRRISLSIGASLRTSM